MTGFGEASAEAGQVRATASLRAVNHRYLDFSLRLPDELRARHREVESAVRERVERGRVEVRIALEATAPPEVAAEIRDGVVRALHGEVERLVAAGLLEGGLSAGDLLRVPGVVELRSESPESEERSWQAAERALDLALAELVTAREAEGGRLARALVERLDALEGIVEKLAGRRERVRRELLEQLRGRLAELLEGREVPEERLLIEAGVLAERGDFGEEIDRLRSHGEHFRALLAETSAVGKRLDFLCQEILRELNTAGSKCRDAEMTRWVVAGKELCEQLREQVQNLE